MESDHNDEAQMLSNTAPQEMPHEMPASQPLDLDLDDPQRWPMFKKLYASLASTGFTFALLFTASAYTAGIPSIMTDFNVSMTKAILPFSLFIWGIIFAPLYSPHVSERFGRTIPYFVSTLSMAIFTLGAAFSRTYTQLAVCRFFAGLCGGSNVVQIEGTWADIWPEMYTGTYYSGLTLASYVGAATGAVVGWHVVPFTNWRWTQYLSLMITLAALLLGIGMPESYRREVIRRKARALNVPHNLPQALSGTTIRAMAQLTVIDPIIILATQPLVLMISLHLSLNFGILFSWFVLVPPVLSGVFKFTPAHVGSAFTVAIAGTVLGVLSSIIIDQISARHASRTRKVDIEHRLLPAMPGTLLIFASLFWVGFTSVPTGHAVVPIIGTGIYVWGSSMTLIAFVSYLFDAYPPQGTLAALTAAACSRVVLAGAIPLLILIAVTNLGGGWALGTFGFLALAFLAFPFILFFFGKRMRVNSMRFYPEEYVGFFDRMAMPSPQMPHQDGAMNFEMEK